jgi:hypothetical protein
MQDDLKGKRKCVSMTVSMHGTVSMDIKQDPFRSLRIRSHIFPTRAYIDSLRNQENGDGVTADDQRRAALHRVPTPGGIQYTF